jgi:hypothetical protein
MISQRFIPRSGQVVAGRIRLIAKPTQANYGLEGGTGQGHLIATAFELTEVKPRNEMTQMKYAISLLLFGAMTGWAGGQTPLQKAFTDLKSSDPELIEKTKEQMPSMLEHEMPSIERDTTTICNGLQDSDSYVRLQAAAILEIIVRLNPEHNQVVLACVPQLISTARTDPEVPIRNHALFALVMNPAGPPPAAHDALLQAFGATNFRSAELAATGLIKEKGANVEDNHKLIAQALDKSADPRHTLNMLYAISGAGVTSDTLFEAAQKHLDDSDPDVQTEAVNAIAISATDKGRARMMLENIQQSSSASPGQKRQAAAVLNRLQSPN